MPCASRASRCAAAILLLRSNTCRADEACGAAVQQPLVPALLQHATSTNRTEKLANLGITPGQLEDARFAELSRSGTHVGSSATGDLKAFITGLCTHVAVCITCILAFGALRMSFPLVYSGNVEDHVAPRQPLNTLFGWVAGSLATTSDEAADAVGLDSALAVEFCSFGARLMVVIALPMLCVLAPLQYFCGGGGLGATDGLGSIALSNVVPTHAWLFHAHAIGVAWVVIVTKMSVFAAQEAFLKRRFQWLKHLPSPRANTVLVEGIPMAFRCEEKLREFFTDHFGSDAVLEVFPVRNCEALERLVTAHEVAQAKKREAELYFQKEGVRPTRRTKWFGPLIDSLDHYTVEVQRTAALVLEERARIKEACHQIGGVNSPSAFVTFKSCRDAALANYVEFSPNADEWMVREPPEASTIRWRDLRQDANAKRTRCAIGYALVCAVFASFSPVCIAISNAATALDLGAFQPMWASIAPSLGLTIFLAMLPSVLLFIFDQFFILRAHALAQHELQMSYFWFQVAFVLFLPTIGIQFSDFADDVYQSPASVFSLLAEKISSSMAFFNNFMVLQWSASCMELLRHMNLVKFLLLRALYPVDEARKLAEPEDQDYYGIGGRSARWTISLMVGLVFCSLSPTIAVLTLVNFIIQRIVYGYLVVFAETRKPDLGGVFWVQSLKQVLQGTVMYSIIMCGILLQRSSSRMPAALALLCVIYTVFAAMQFDTQFRWKVLPFAEVSRSEVFKEDRALVQGESYEQPEMQDN